jgi:hypothetical protein
MASRELSCMLEKELVLFAMEAAGDVNPLDGPMAAMAISVSVHRALRVARPIVEPEIALKLCLAEFPAAPPFVHLGPDREPAIEHFGPGRWQELGRDGPNHGSQPPVGTANRRRLSNAGAHTWRGRRSKGRAASFGRIASEVYPAVGLAIRRQAVTSLTIVIAQTNGALGYLASEDQHSLGGREIRESCFFYRTRGPLSPTETEQALGILDLIAEVAA